VSGWQELGDSVFCRNYESLDFNVGAVVGPEGLLVIDTRADLVEARELRDHLRELSPNPVLWVVNTHYHWDHAWGNAEFVPAQIWGHVRCAEVLRSDGERQKATVRASSPERAGRIDDVVITPPEHTFEDRASIEVGGGRVVGLVHLGRGHTDSDLVVTVSGSEVTFAGDLIENGAPPSFGDSFPIDWPAAVGRLLKVISPSGPVVPGHGPVADRAFVAGQHQELERVAQIARELHQAGAPPHGAAPGAPYSDAVMRSALVRAFAQLDGSLG
jgi:glyoxylase-like metal-dependent hydrolase (beta-lactamase superfamily II)